jgi:hypothetical protein
VNLKKLKVKDLKKILSNWGEDNACKGCAEKSDFIKVVEDLMPKYKSGNTDPKQLTQGEADIISPQPIFSYQY